MRYVDVWDAADALTHIMSPEGRRAHMSEALDPVT